VPPWIKKCPRLNPPGPILGALTGLTSDVEKFRRDLLTSSLDTAVAPAKKFLRSLEFFAG
jgi:hypothetical protein